GGGADEVLDRGEIVRELGEALWPIEEVGEVVGQRGSHSGSAFDSVGELRRVSGGERDHGDVGIAPALLRGTETHGGVRVDQYPGAAVGAGDDLGGLVVVDAGTAPRTLEGGEALRPDGHVAVLTESIHEVADGRTIASEQFEEQPLEVR